MMNYDPQQTAYSLNQQRQPQPFLKKHGGRPRSKVKITYQTIQDKILCTPVEPLNQLQQRIYERVKAKSKEYKNKKNEKVDEQLPQVKQCDEIDKKQNAQVKAKYLDFLQRKQQAKKVPKSKQIIDYSQQIQRLKAKIASGPTMVKYDPAVHGPPSRKKASPKKPMKQAAKQKRAIGMPDFGQLFEEDDSKQDIEAVNKMTNFTAAMLGQSVSQHLFKFNYNKYYRELAYQLRVSEPEKQTLRPDRKIVKYPKFQLCEVFGSHSVYKMGEYRLLVYSNSDATQELPDGTRIKFSKGVATTALLRLTAVQSPNETKLIFKDHPAIKYQRRTESAVTTVYHDGSEDTVEQSFTTRVRGGTRCKDFGDGRKQWVYANGCKCLNYQIEQNQI